MLNTTTRPTSYVYFQVWNAVVFTQVHVFHGHRSAITGLQTHKIDPLLFSSSLDGSVQIWRMDNFSKVGLL